MGWLPQCFQISWVPQIIYPEKCFMNSEVRINSRHDSNAVKILEIILAMLIFIIIISGSF